MWGVGKHWPTCVLSANSLVRLADYPASGVPSDYRTSNGLVSTVTKCSAELTTALCYKCKQSRSATSSRAMEHVFFGLLLYRWSIHSKQFLLESMSTAHRSISPENLAIGDVLLCYVSAKHRLEQKVSNTTHSGYTHAAICIGDGQIASATLSGVTVEPFSQLIVDFDHVAVFRQPHAWTPRRTKELPLFVRAVMRSGAKYNLAGVKKFKEAKELHEWNTT